jgi:hypothetical protein
MTAHLLNHDATFPAFGTQRLSRQFVVGAYLLSPLCLSLPGRHAFGASTCGWRVVACRLLGHLVSGLP